MCADNCLCENIELYKIHIVTIHTIYIVAFLYCDTTLCYTPINQYVKHIILYVSICHHLAHMEVAIAIIVIILHHSHSSKEREDALGSMWRDCR